MCMGHPSLAAPWAAGAPVLLFEKAFKQGEIALFVLVTQSYSGEETLDESTEGLRSNGG